MIQSKKIENVKLNLGCGPDIRAGYINVDILGGDVKCDLRKIPWPWPDNYADEILMSHVLEHLPDTYETMNEIHRILKPGGKFWGQVPYGLSEAAFFHPQHCRYFIDNSFKTLAEHTDFIFVKTELVSLNTNWQLKIRNMLPFRSVLKRFIINMYDAVNFELKKPGSTPISTGKVIT
jgi:predicted SAM-dependent methyltransferase